MAFELTKKDLLPAPAPAPAPSTNTVEAVLNFMSSLERMAQYSLNIIAQLKELKSNPELQAMLAKRQTQKEQAPAHEPELIFSKIQTALQGARELWGNITIEELQKKITENKPLIINLLSKQTQAQNQTQTQNGTPS